MHNGPTNPEIVTTDHATYRYATRLALDPKLSNITLHKSLECRAEKARVIGDREMRDKGINHPGSNGGGRYRQYREDVLGVYVLEFMGDFKFVTITSFKHEQAYHSNSQPKFVQLQDVCGFYPVVSLWV